LLKLFVYNKKILDNTGPCCAGVGFCAGFGGIFLDL